VPLQELVREVLTLFDEAEPSVHALEQLAHASQLRGGAGVLLARVDFEELRDALRDRTEEDDTSHGEDEDDAHDHRGELGPVDHGCSRG